MKRHISLYSYISVHRFEVTIWRDNEYKTYNPTRKSLDRLGKFISLNIGYPCTHVGRSGIGVWFDYDK